MESWFGFMRRDSAVEPFGEEEKMLLDYAMRPMAWFQRQVILHRGVSLVEDPLTPSERRVLNERLTDRPEREIAEITGLTQATVHTYATRICRKFNVRGRAGLMALWLGQMDAPEVGQSAPLAKEPMRLERLLHAEFGQ